MSWPPTTVDLVVFGDTFDEIHNEANAALTSFFGSPHFDSEYAVTATPRGDGVRWLYEAAVHAEWDGAS
jgi:hypothetical protein